MPAQPGIGRTLQTIRERRRLLIGVFAAVLGAAILYLAVADNVYESRADLLISPIASQDPIFSTIGVLTQSADPTLEAETAAQLVDSSPVAERATRKLDDGTDVNALLDAISVQPIPESNIVSVTAQGPTPESARDRANAFANAAVQIRRAKVDAAIDKVLGGLRQQLDAAGTSPAAEALATLVAELTAFKAGGDPTIQLESPASTPTSRVSPQTGLTLVLAVLGGLTLGLVVALASQALDPLLRREEQLRSLYRLPILARVPKESRRTGPLVPTHLSPLAREAYRTLRATLAERAGSGGGPQSIVVAGSGPSEGKSTTAINLASSLALAGNSVILIEADLRRPSIGKALQVAPSSGIVSVLLGNSSLEESLIPVPNYNINFSLLLAEEASAEFAEILSLPVAQDLLREATRTADYVIIDSPPLSDVIDALPLAREADTVLITTHLGRTRLSKLRELSELLSANAIQPAGFVLLGVSRAGREVYEYHAPGAGLAGRTPSRVPQASTR